MEQSEVHMEKVYEPWPLHVTYHTTLTSNAACSSFTLMQKWLSGCYKDSVTILWGSGHLALCSGSPQRCSRAVGQVVFHGQGPGLCSSFLPGLPQHQSSKITAGRTQTLGKGLLLINSVPWRICFPLVNAKTTPMTLIRSTQASHFPIFIG